MKIVFKSSKDGEEKFFSNVAKVVWAANCFWLWFTDEQEDIYLPDKFNQIISCEVRVIA